MKNPLVKIAALCIAALASTSLLAQTYPEKPIQVLVPMQAASAGDSIVRIIVQKMTENMGQSLVVQNLPGAAGLIGTEKIAKSPPDGYAIGVMGDSMLTLLPHFHTTLGFDPLQDFAPISLMANVTMVLVANPALGVTNVKELIERAHAKPGAINYASGGNGSSQHVTMELFKLQTKSFITHIPYRGASQAAIDVVGGGVPVMFSALSVALPFIKDGRLRPLAVTGAQRSTLLPAVPTLVETGLPSFTFSPWVGMYAPKGTPRPMIELLNREVAKALADPGVKERLINLGLQPEGSTPEALGAKMREGSVEMAKVIKQAQIRMN